MTMNSEPKYTSVAIGLHWLLALLILATFGAGLYLGDLPLSPGKLQMINWHKWAGITILSLSALRLAWRLAHRPPALPARIEQAMPRWQLAAYHAVHHLLYLMFFVVPMLGWAYSSAKGFQVVWFGVLPLPNLLDKNEPLAEILKEAHALAAFALMGLVLLHVAAAIKHQVIDRDGLLARMRPGR